MSANSYGRIFRITTFGESHGGAVGVVIDGCPPGHRIALEMVQAFLNRRRPGQSPLTSPRQEADLVECLSGLENGITLGTPLTLVVRNRDAKPEHYQDIKGIYRPSHADYTWEKKFGLTASSGGGRASARETIGRVAAAAVAEQILEELLPGTRVVAYVDSIHNLTAPRPDINTLTRDLVEASPVRCPDPDSSRRMIALITAVKQEGDSLGGVITGVVQNPPVGLGDPVFDKLEARLGQAMLSLPATKGFEIGSGFAGTQWKGSAHNDEFILQQDRITTATNHSGGVQGGISNGAPIVFRVAFKPVATVFKEQSTVTRGDNPSTVSFKPKEGRHDPCVLPRAVPLVEAMTILTLLDSYIYQSAVRASAGPHRN